MHPATPLIVGLCFFAGQSGTTWRDPSPHQAQFVTVDSAVRLEVLDDTSRAEAKRLGLEKFFDENAGWTGTIAILDGRSKEVTHD